MKKPGIAIVGGPLLRQPLGGVFWEYIGYLTGLRKLGWNVYYYEECESEKILDPYTETSRIWNSLKFLSDEMKRFGFAGMWSVCRKSRGIKQTYYGIPRHKMIDLLRSCDAFINVSGSIQLEEKEVGGKKIYIDTDPAFTQGKIISQKSKTTAEYLTHNAFFTYGLNVGGIGYPLSLKGDVLWRKTVPPCPLGSWEPVTNRGNNRFTTITQWSSYEDVRVDGVVYGGSKRHEFLRFRSIPSLTGEEFEISGLCHPKYFAEVMKMERCGWRFVDSRVSSLSTDMTASYIRSSLAEFTVAKPGYVKAKCGWFGMREACYMASGKPVILQNTGFNSFLRTGKGLFSFSTVEEGVDCVARLLKDYEFHSQHAIKLAGEFEDALVMRSIMERA